MSLLLPNGKTPLLIATTTSEGLFSFIGVRPGTYVLRIGAAGFNEYRANDVLIDPARTTSWPPIKLEVQSAVQTVDVGGHVQAVETTSFQVSNTVTQAQVENLPVLDGQVSNLFLTQAGVTNNGANETVINGLRTSYANVTLDGINIQDNFIRVNGLDFFPNKVTVSEVQEFTVVTSNEDSTVGGGATQVVMVTPSGGNQMHGEGYWRNRVNTLAANDWFNNKDGVEKPRLVLNQLGGALGGAVIKDKLFYYGFYEAYRLKQTSPSLSTILTPSARQGIVTFKAGGQVQSFNVLKASNLSIDPAVQSLLQSVPTVSNSSDTGDGLNTTGYAFNARSNETRDNASGKVDYNFSTRHVFSGTYKWNRDIVDRPDQGLIFTVVPPVFNDDNGKFLAASWRWTPTPSMTNEVRGGFNRTLGTFKIRAANPTYAIGGLLFDSPQNTFQPQGRNTDAYHLQDNANYIRGKHNLAFGFQSQLIRVAPYDFGGTLPAYGIGLSTTSPYGFSTGDLGLPANYVGTANALLASLGGIVSDASQGFNVTSRTSGFVAGAPNSRHYTFDIYSGYFKDNWKVLPRLTLTLGLRYDYFTRFNESDALTLLPVIPSGKTFIDTLLSNATLNFAGNAVGRPYYNKDLNNFAPNVGLAWDVFGDGRTSLRGGYSIAYVNDDAIEMLSNNIDSTNQGLSSSSALTDQNGKLTGGLPKIPVPVFKVPRTFSDNYDLNPGNAQGLPDPNLRTPYVQTWNFGIQHELKHGFVVEGRYVGNHGTKEFRQFDYNQVVIRQNGFLGDFIKARKNGFLSLAAGRGFNPAYVAAIPGSQPLPVFAQLVSGGFLNVASVRSLIQSGQPGALGTLYQTAGVNGNIDFFRNPYGLGMNTVANYSNSTFEAVQLEVRKRTTGDLQFQANYQFGKVLTDASANGATRGFEPFLDAGNPSLERARAVFDIRHVFKVNYSYPLPFGPGKRFSFHPLNRLIGGWSLTGFLIVQSGPPVSVLSQRATLNRSGSRSAGNTAITPMTADQLGSIVGFRMTGNGPVFIAPGAIGTDGRGVAPDGSAPFNGQVFFNPDPGSVGTLQRRFFSGPWYYADDFAVLKDVKITERHQMQIKADFYNLTNHPNFFVGDQNINSTQFGKITSVYAVNGLGPRVIQLGLRYKF